MPSSQLQWLKIHGFRLNFAFILGKGSRWIPHISSTRTSCQKWQECILVRFAGHAIASSTCKIAVSQTKWLLSLHVHWFGCAQGLWSGLSKKVPQEHLAASAVMGAVRFTCCKRLSQLPTGSLLRDRSSCQFWGLFWKHKQIFTGLLWIAGHVDKCRIANSSKLQMAMIPPRILQTMVPIHPKPSGELGWLQCPWLSTVFTSSKIYPL